MCDGGCIEINGKVEKTRKGIQCPDDGFSFFLVAVVEGGDRLAATVAVDFTAQQSSSLLFCEKKEQKCKSTRKQYGYLYL